MNPKKLEPKFKVGVVMNNEKLNEMAEAYSVTKGDNILEELAIEAHFKSGFQAALSLPEVKVMKEALAYYADKDNWVYGDVPMHVYAHDDAGHTARKALADLGEVME